MSPTALSRVDWQTKRLTTEAWLRQHPDWSDRRLAGAIGVSRELVRKVRGALGLEVDEVVTSGGYTMARKRPPFIAVGSQFQAEPTHDDELNELVVRVLDVIDRSKDAAFLESYPLASRQARRAFESVVIQLAARENRLRKLGTVEGGAS